MQSSRGKEVEMAALRNHLTCWATWVSNRGDLVEKYKLLLMMVEIEIASLVCSVKSSLRNPCTFKGNAFHNFIFNATLRQLNQLFGAYPSHNPFNMVLCIVEPLNHSQPKKLLARLIKTLSSVIGCAAAFLVIVIALGGAICRYLVFSFERSHLEVGRISTRGSWSNLRNHNFSFPWNKNVSSCVFNFPVSENILETQYLPT